MIKKIHVQKLRVSELLQFLNDVIKLCNQQSTEPMKMAAVIATLVTDTNTYDQFFKLDPGSAITKDLILLDDRRDECVTGIHIVLEGYSHYFESTLRTAAQNLLSNMNKYGSQIYDLNYQAETSTITNLLNEWSANSTLAAAVTALNLGAWTAELKTANDLFNDSYLKRVDEKASAPQIKSFQARKKAISTYRELVQQIEARATLAGDGTYNSLINSLNSLIEKYNTLGDNRTEKPGDEN